MMRNWAHGKKNILKMKIRQHGPTFGEEAAGVAGGPCASLSLILFRFHKGTVKLYYDKLAHLQTFHRNQR
jgi:hypothetical protein